MATTNTARTEWQGTLFQGSGRTELVTSGAATFDVNWNARAESGQGTTNPEELIAAAHSTCYSMALANHLDEAGYAADQLDVSAEVGFQPGEGVTGITLTVSGQVPGLSDDEFAAHAEWAKENCPVSQALKAVDITLAIN